MVNIINSKIQSTTITKISYVTFLIYLLSHEYNDRTVFTLLKYLYFFDKSLKVMKISLFITINEKMIRKVINIFIIK